LRLRRYTGQTIKLENFGSMDSFACGGCGGSLFEQSLIRLGLAHGCWRGATVSVTRRVSMRDNGTPVCDTIPSHLDPAMAMQQKRRFYAVLWSALVAFLILLVGQRTDAQDEKKKEPPRSDLGQDSIFWR
jgi:hypothetical protein